MIIRSLVFSTTALLLVSCGTAQVMEVSGTNPPPGRTKHAISPPVLLQVVTTRGVDSLEIIDGPGCPDNSGQKGCASIPPNHYGYFTFMLHKGKHEDCDRGGTGKYRLVGIELSEQSDKDYSDKVSEQVQCDFDTDPEGEVQPSNLIFDAHKMKVIDQNMNALDEPYKVWYKVKAMNCTTGNIISSDPWIENKGTNPSR